MIPTRQHRTRRDPRTTPRRLGAWLALLGVLGLCLASSHGLHAHDRPDPRSDLPQWSASTGDGANLPSDLHDGSLCNACRTRSDSKSLAVDVQGIAIARPEERRTVPHAHAAPRPGGRWQDAPAPPRAPPIG